MTFPFTEDRKRETAIVRDAEREVARRHQGGGGGHPRDVHPRRSPARASWHDEIAWLAEGAHKVIAVAYREIAALPGSGEEPDAGFEFAGLLAFEDPVREGRRRRRAGGDGRGDPPHHGHRGPPEDGARGRKERRASAARRRASSRAKSWRARPRTGGDGPPRRGRRRPREAGPEADARQEPPGRRADRRGHGRRGQRRARPSGRGRRGRHGRAGHAERPRGRPRSCSSTTTSAPSWGPSARAGSSSRTCGRASSTC